MNVLPDGIATVAAEHAVMLLLLIKITGLLAITWVLHVALIRNNPRWRVLLWRTAAMGVIALTLLTFLPSSWQIPVRLLPIRRPAVASVALPESGFQPPAVNSQLELPTPRVLEVQTHPHFPNTPSSIRGESTTSPNLDDSPSTPIAHAVYEPSGPASVRSLFAWPISGTFWRLTVSVWFAGVIVGVARAVIGLVRLSKIRRSAKAVPTAIQAEAEQIALALGLGRACEIRETTELRVPCLTGLLRPLVLLPHSVINGDNQRAECSAALAHELAHLRGRDLIWNALLQALSIVLWFHPLVWRMRLAHADACDAVCDALAADYVGDVALYGRTLARLALRSVAFPAALGLAMARTSQVRRRITALERFVFRDGLPPRRVVCLGFSLVMAILLAGATAITSSQAEPPPLAATTAPPVTSASAGQPNTNNPLSSGRLLIQVFADDTGRPLEGANVQFEGRIGEQRVSKELRTNESGATELEYEPGALPAYLWMTVTAERRVPVHYSWRNDRGKTDVTLPAELNLRLAPGLEIGGIIRDEAGRPIAGAEIQVMMPITSPRLQSHVFTAAEFVTKADGRWKWDGAPLDLGAVSLWVEHADYIRGGGAATRSLDNVVVLKQGQQVAGRVTDREGRPIAKATARLGFDRFGTNEPTATTNDDGRFVLKNARAGKSLVTVQAEGFAPAFQELTVDEAPSELKFQLEPGRTLRIRVVDSDARPIAGATVVTDTWRGYRTLELRSQTDAAGEITWTSAPPDAVLCDILKKGHMAIRRKPLTAADYVQIVTMPPPLVITGRVTDAATDQPIPSFGIQQGQIPTGASRIYWSRDEAARFENGSYRYEFTEPVNGRSLQVQADGYQPANSRTFESTEGSVTFDFALRPAKGPSGIVLLPGGQPAAGAEVCLATRERRAFFKLGRFDRNQNQAELVKTDAAGRFTFLPPDDEQFLLIAVHDAGIAEVLGKDLTPAGELKLIPWGKLQVRSLVANKPDAKREVVFFPRSDAARKTQPFIWDYGCRGITDDDGRFEFDRIPPGPGSAGRTVITQFLRSTQHAYGWQTPVEIRPNETATVTIGGTGRPLIGRVVLDRQPDVTIDWTTNQPAEVSIWDSIKGQRERESPRLLGNISKSGEFRIEDVPAGTYKVTVPVNNPPSPNACGAGEKVGQGELEFTVLEIPGGSTDEPLNVGVVTATLFDTLDPGEIAPNFVAERLNGGTLKSQDLHGKLVLIDFWATWCQPCLAEMPHLKAIHDRFGNNPRFTILGLSCDEQAAVARRYVESNGLTWQQAHIGSTYSRIAGQFTIHSLPATFLIDPHGRVLAKNLKADELEPAIAAALADDRLFLRTNENRSERFPPVRLGDASAPPAFTAAPAIVVLDDIDPNFERTRPHHDGLRLLDSSGAELWSHSGLNNCQCVGGRGVALDRRRQRIYIRENVADRITAFSTRGQKLWQIEQIAVGPLAIDEKTGNLWCGLGGNLNDGEIVVFDPQGRELAAYPYPSVELALDPLSSACWSTGTQTLKIGATGDVLFRQRVDGWCWTSMSINPADGSVWLAEREHPDVANSKNRLWLLSADGSIRHKVDLGTYKISVVRYSPQTGDAWIGSYKEGIRRVSADAQLSEPLALMASRIAISPTTGDLWGADADAVFRFDRSGQILARSAFSKPSQQCWLEAF